MISRIAATLAGLGLVIYGVVAAISPFLPAGVPLIALGLLTIALANPSARPILRQMRVRWRWFDRLVLALGRRSPDSIRRVIAETAPDTPRDPAAKEDG